MRGKWGEVQLRRVVEAAGLIERVDFDLQSSISSDAGLGKPDMVVHLPGGKNIAVDAKVPFTAYMEASSIPMTATGEEGARRERLLKDHVAAVRAHIDALGKKSYWDGLEASPELVICFIPSEALVSSALEADPGLMDHAFFQEGRSGFTGHPVVSVENSRVLVATRCRHRGCSKNLHHRHRTPSAPGGDGWSH